MRRSASFLICMFLLLGLGSAAQQVDSLAVSVEKRDTIARTPWTNEAILSLSYANGGMAFGLVYKRQVAAKRYFRMSIADISFYRNQSDPVYTNQFPSRHLRVEAELNVGVEWRFRLHKRVSTYTGIDVLAGFGYYQNRLVNPSLPPQQLKDEDYSITAGLAFNSGVIIDVHDMIKVGLNVSPDVFYRFSPWDYENGVQEFKGANHRVSTSFSSGSIQLQVIFHWERKPYKLSRPK